MLTAMLDSKRRGRRRGISVRDGSVRQARKEPKPPLAQVAGLKVSRTAIHLIETGRCRPSLDTLEQIARQTHKPVEFFLLSPDGAPELTQSRKDLDELERLSATRDFGQLINLGRAHLEKQVGEEATALIRFYLGQAYCRTVRPVEALEHLRLARQAFEQVGDEWMAVEALDWEASALGLMEDPLAIATAGEALSRCRKLDPKPPQVEARILVHLANMHVVAHSWAQAIGYYEAAVEAS